MSLDGLATKAISEWPIKSGGEKFLVGYFVGEGIGAEIIPPALDILSAVCRRLDKMLELRQGGLIGRISLDATGKALNDEAIAFCAQIFSEGGAIICGPGGDRFVYELRRHFDLYCKFTPIIPCPALLDTGCIKPQQLEGVDILAVRENTGGLYFGESSRSKNEKNDTVVIHSYSYRESQVRRILTSAFAVARQRSGKVCVTLKPGGIPSISGLWQEQAEKLSAEMNVDMKVLEIDNAVYQLIANPRSFDVIVSPNMFGDVLADAGAILLCSRGMSYSGNFGASGKAVYQTAHGAAYDIAGSDSANPLGQVMSVAMMLRESFGLPEASDLIHKAVNFVLGSGFRTTDIASPESRVVGTKEMSRLLIEALSREDNNNCASATTDRPAA